jgi:hypothetical protein
MDVKNLLRAQWDRVLAVTFVVAGAIALLVGWLGISGTALSYKQVPYIVSGGLLGVVLVGIGLTLYLSADLRDEWRKLDSIEDTLREALDRLDATEVPAPAPLVTARKPRATRAPRPAERERSVGAVAR